MTGAESLLDVEVCALARDAEITGGQTAGDPGDDRWIAFCLRFLTSVVYQLRQTRYSDFKAQVSLKQDVSPVSAIEKNIEALFRQRLKAFERTASIAGEESGGEIDSTGITLAIDPIDGTWSFINRTETFATTLALFRQGQADLAFAANPATGEIAYAGRGGRARLLQLGLADAPTQGYDLPLPPSAGSGLLVNLHPCRDMRSAITALVETWEEGNTQLVRSSGGSPVWSMLDAAKGTCTYVNLWPGKPADPFDLAAGLLLVRAAGGDVIDLSGNAVSATGHSGPFIAGTNKTHLQKAAEIIRGAVPIDG